MAYLVGALLALAVGGLGTVVGLDRDRAFYPTIMIVIAFYYILFAVMGAEGRLRDNILVLPPVADVRIEPHDTTLQIGDSMLVRFVAEDSRGAEYDISLGYGYTAGPEPYAFALLRTVHPNGFWLAARAVGKGRIWTELGPRVDTAHVRVIDTLSPRHDSK